MLTNIQIALHHRAPSALFLTIMNHLLMHRRHEKMKNTGDDEERRKFPRKNAKKMVNAMAF